MKFIKLCILTLVLAVAAPVIADDTKPAPTRKDGQTGEPVAKIALVDDSNPDAIFTVADPEPEIIPDEPKPYDEEPKEGLGVNLGVGSTVYAGTFITDEYESRERVQMNISTKVSYSMPEIATVSVGMGYSQWLTQGGGQVDSYEGRVSDGVVAIARNLVTIPVVGINVGAELSFVLPFSTSSRFAGLYTSTGLGLGLSRTFGDFTVAYSFGVQKNFNKFTSATGDLGEIDILSRSNGNELLGDDLVAIGGVLVEWSIVNQLSLSYIFMENFRVAVSAGITDAWTYDNGSISVEDEYTSQYARVGRGFSDQSVGGLSLSWAPIEYLTVVLAVSSRQPLKSADNKEVLNPFFDTKTPNNNYTKFTLSLQGSY